MSYDNQITLAEIRAAKRDAESEIMAALQKLKERTGMTPTGCELLVFRGATFGDLGSNLVLSDVTLTLEPI